MFSVSPEIYQMLWQGSRWLFAALALMLLLITFGWHFSERKKRRDRLHHLPGAGTVGEMIVLYGSDELPVNTWFPVPREGVLGSLRTCDLVVPCPGVRSRHLDFFWRDGTGLLVRPCPGCEVLVDGLPVSKSAGHPLQPLIHGSCLQVGSAVLRLQLFAAMDHTGRSPAPEAGFPEMAVSPPAAQPDEVFIPGMPENTTPAVNDPAPDSGFAPVSPVIPEVRPVPENDPSQNNGSVPDSVPDLQSASAPRRRRADRWKEDFSE